MIKKLLISAMLCSFLGATTLPAASYAVSPVGLFADSCAGTAILTFKNWDSGLACNNGAPDLTQTGLNGIWIIVLNIIDDVIQGMGYVAVGFIVWGGIKYMKSQGDPSQLNESRDTILNAVIGLGIVLASVAIVNFVSGSLAK